LSIEIITKHPQIRLNYYKKINIYINVQLLYMYVQIMNKLDNSQQELDLLRKIKDEPGITQRDLAISLSFSLGKLNYCLLALKKKGLVKINNFFNQKNKLKYIKYILTKKGIAYRAELTINLMKLKMEEYNELKREIKKENINTKNL